MPNRRVASIAKRTVWSPTRVAFSALVCQCFPPRETAWPRSLRLRSGRRCCPSTEDWRPASYRAANDLADAVADRPGDIVHEGDSSAALNLAGVCVISYILF